MRALSFLPTALACLATAAPLASQEPDRLLELERRRQALLESRQRDLQQMDRQLSSLAVEVGPRATIPDLVAALRRDSARVALLEGMNLRQLAARYDLQALRYQTGLEILGVVLRNSEKLDFTTSLAATLTAFDQAANPLNSPAFLAEMEAISGAQGEGARLSLPDALMQNPVVSAAHFLASLFSSRLNRREKENAFARISCVLDFTTKANQDARDLRSQLGTVEQAVQRLLRDASDAFSRYVGVAGATTDWATFRRVQAGVVQTGVPARIDAYFAARKASAMERPWAIASLDDFVESNFQLDQVKLLLNQHEVVLAGMEGFLEQFEGTVRRYERAECEAIPGLSTTVALLIQQSSENRTRFRAGWFGDVPARSRAILYTNP